MIPSVPMFQLKRRAKMLARREKIPLHEALDRVAREEGFAAWSLLCASSAAAAPPQALLPRLANGDMLLVGARPNQGKTLLALRLLLDAAREGRRAVFFTLEYSERETRRRLRSLSGFAVDLAHRLEIVTSNDIEANFIVEALSGSPAGTVAVVDYLQILDQQRRKPALSDQLLVLRDFARRNGVILAFISQIDRAFEARGATPPGVADVHLPNPISMDVFAKACFLHKGEVRLQNVA